MGTYKRSSKGIVDEKGNIVKSFMIPSNDVQGQVSMEFNSENGVSIISSEAEKEPILEESGLPASIEKNEMTLWKRKTKDTNIDTSQESWSRQPLL